MANNCWTGSTPTPSPERQFADPAHAEAVADIFIKELLRNGTTTALVFGSVHPQSVNAFFEAAEKLDLRMIAGKVMMDRNAPDYLTDTAESSYTESKALIERWHGKGRLHYAVTPRFAPTSTPEQLALAGQLLGSTRTCTCRPTSVKTCRKCNGSRRCFPSARAIWTSTITTGCSANVRCSPTCVHLCDEECARLAETGSAIAFCPTSNLFLGSGLFNLPMAEKHKVNVGLGTDVGGGTSFSLLQTLNEAYKVMQLQGARLSPFKSLYLATLGGARALRLEDRIGTLQPGTDADFLVLDYNATPLLSYRLKQARDIAEILFVLMTLGDDRTVAQTFAAGRLVHQR
ncbi:guanine deaminase [Pseudomonas corrugata]